MVYRVKQGQSIYDLAVLYGYGIERVVEFLQAAPQLVSLDNIQLGDKEIDVTKIKTNLVVYLNLYATGIGSEQEIPADWLMDDDGNLLLDDDGNPLFTT